MDEGDVPYEADPTRYPYDGGGPVVDKRPPPKTLQESRSYQEFPREAFTTALAMFQLDHKEWSTYNFPPEKRTDEMMRDGMLEELGELAHARLKFKQGIRGMTEEKYEELSKDCIADLFVFMVAYSTARGWDFGQLVAEVWERVRTRDWKSNPSTGGDSSPVTQGG